MLWATWNVNDTHPMSRRPKPQLWSPWHQRHLRANDGSSSGAVRDRRGEHEPGDIMRARQRHGLHSRDERNVRKSHEFRHHVQRDARSVGVPGAHRHGGGVRREAMCWQEHVHSRGDAGYFRVEHVVCDAHLPHRVALLRARSAVQVSRRRLTQSANTRRVPVHRSS